MEVWIIFREEWDPYAYAYNCSIQGVYDKEEKAYQVRSSLEEEGRKYYNSLSRFGKEEWDELGYKLDTYRIEKHSVL